MSSAVNPITLLTRLNTPEQDLARLSFCNGNTEADVKRWLEDLPVTQAAVVASHFYKALPEIVRLQTTPAHRFAMLELLRVAVFQCLQGLAKSFINQPLILPEPARKAATLAQALQKHLANGYLVVVKELFSSPPKNGTENQQQALAIHRAITSLGLFLVRNYQLYGPVSPHIWGALHTLYWIAELNKQSTIPLTDPLPYHTSIHTIEQAWTRLLLLAAARPNQLRQDEILATYRILDTLAPLVTILPFDAIRKENLFVVALNGHQPPHYKSRISSPKTDFLRELDTRALIKTIEAAVTATEDKSQTSNTRLEGVGISLARHLNQAWNMLAQRNFDRVAAQGHLEVTVGLTNIHYHVSEKTPFDVFLKQNSATQATQAKEIFQQRGLQLKTEEKDAKKDPWGEVLEVSNHWFDNRAPATDNIEFTIRQHQQTQYQGVHPTFHIPLVDTSAGGYCLEWQDTIPVQVKAGELLGIREQGRSKWAIAVVRWAQQTRDVTHLGIQVLAPMALPVGIANIHKTGNFTEYLRGLQLPALRAINQPTTLITNSVSFHEFDKVKLYSLQKAESTQANSGEQMLQLTTRQFSTGAFSRFTFKAIASTVLSVSKNDIFKPS